MSARAISKCTRPGQAAGRMRSLEPLRQTIESLTRDSASLIGAELGPFYVDGEAYWLPRLLFLGPSGGDAPLRLNVFAGVSGDEPAGCYALLRFASLLRQYPEAARGYCLFLYPLCNPTGFEDNTAHSRRGRDLSREFWGHSPEPEVQLLEAELRVRPVHGLVVLQAGEASQGVEGCAAGGTFSSHLLEPALRAAEELLPRQRQEPGNGPQEQAGPRQAGGYLSAPPGVRPRPFEILLQTPKDAPQFLQEQACLLALSAILEEYRKLMAYAPNL